MKDTCSKSSLNRCIEKNISEMLFFAGAATGDDGYRNGVAYSFHQCVVESLALAVHVDAIEHDFASSECLACFGEGYSANVCGLSSAFDSALIPAVLFVVGSSLGGW